MIRGQDTTSMGRSTVVDFELGDICFGVCMACVFGLEYMSL